MFHVSSLTLHSSLRTMLPKEYLQFLSAAVVKRSGICQATVERVLPALFDEIRQQLCEGQYPCVPIESFGTFTVVDIPERQHLYTYKGRNELRTLAPTKRLKFAPTRNLRREVEDGHFDPTRQSFRRHPKDPAIRKRSALVYRPCRDGVYKGATKKVKS